MPTMSTSSGNPFGLIEGVIIWPPNFLGYNNEDTVVLYMYTLLFKFVRAL